MVTKTNTWILLLAATIAVSSCKANGRWSDLSPNASIPSQPRQQDQRSQAAEVASSATLPKSSDFSQAVVGNSPLASPNGCLNPSSVDDPDIRRNAAKLPMSKYCIKLASFTEGGFPWKIYTVTPKRGNKDILWAVPHDDEDAAFDTAVYALNRYGGRISTVETGNRRSFHGQDTNRNFGTSRSVQQRCRQQKAVAPRYTKEFLNGYSDGGLIIALHTNTNGYSGNGGTGTISINRDSSILRPYKSPVAQGLLADEDNLLLMAGTRPVGSDRQLTAAVNHFTKQEGVHVIVELVRESQNDCSLSNYVMLTKPGRYYNIEAEDGNGTAQRQILDKLMAYIRN